MRERVGARQRAPMHTRSRVLEPSSGKQRWNVSLGQYALDVVPPERADASYASRGGARARVGRAWAQAVSFSA